MKKKNEIAEALSCVLLILIVALEYTYQNRQFLSIIILVMGIGIFSILTFLTINDHKDYSSLKCISMLICLLILIQLLCEVNMLIPITVLLGFAFFSESQKKNKTPQMSDKKMKQV